MGKEVIFFILIVSVVIGISLGFVIPAIIVQKPQIEVGSDKPGINENYINYTNFTQLISTSGNMCEDCHFSGKKYIPQAYGIKGHVEGGAFCLKCHKITHEKHPVNDNVTCASCHGETYPKIPTPLDGKISCNNCHAYPDALSPSYGNLVGIHNPRGVSCISCHINCVNCHERIPDNDRWNKRNAHFNTLLGSYK